MRPIILSFLLSLLILPMGFGQITIKVGEGSLSNDALVPVTIQANSEVETTALQFTIQWDAAALELENIALPCSVPQKSNNGLRSIKNPYLRLCQNVERTPQNLKSELL